MNVVLDTNVLVSGLKTRGGTCAQVLDLVVEGRITLCVDDRVLDEYERVCNEPRVAQVEPQDDEVNFVFCVSRACYSPPCPCASTPASRAGVP
jgi:putative PIN family toxin of toxin-antitoxin system